MIGACKRNIEALPRPVMGSKRAIRSFVRHVIRKLLKPLTQIKTFEQWLDGSNYPSSRKTQLRLIHKQLPQLTSQIRECLKLIRAGNPIPARLKKTYKRVFDVKQFVKAEFYDAVKYPRTINSRSDHYKVLVGPAVSSMETVVYQLKYFIKHVPDNLRCQYILDNLTTDAVCTYSCDFTSFEESFVAEVQHAIELQLYSYLLSNFPFELSLVCQQADNNSINAKGYSLHAECCRMSGEMTTSLGNGFTNLILNMWQLHQRGEPWINYKGVIEGDDSLSTSTAYPDETLWTDLGFRAKVIHERGLNTASFCGKIFDTSTLTTIGDPRYYLASAGWTLRNVNCSEKNRRLLTYVKGVSFMHQFNGCPIVPQLGLRLVKSSQVTEPEAAAWFQTTQAFDLYDRARISDLTIPILRDPPPSARAIMADCFGVEAHTQSAIEQQLLIGDGPLQSDLILSIMPKQWKDNYSKATTHFETIPIARFTPSILDCTAPATLVDMSRHVMFNPQLLPELA
jgi:hypothetical protein